MLIAFYKNLEGQVVTMSDNKIRIDNFEAKEWFSSRKWGNVQPFFKFRTEPLESIRKRVQRL